MEDSQVDSCARWIVTEDEIKELRRNERQRNRLNFWLSTSRPNKAQLHLLWSCLSMTSCLWEYNYLLTGGTLSEFHFWKKQKFMLKYLYFSNTATSVSISFFSFRAMFLLKWCPLCIFHWKVTNMRVNSISFIH